MRAVIISLRIVACVMLFGLIGTPLAQVVMRSIFDVPMASAEEIARYMLICLTFLAAALVTLDGGQIRMEEFQATLPERPRWMLQLLIEASGVLFFGYLAAAGCITISRNLNSRTAVTEIPFMLFMGPLALGAAFLALACLWQLRTTWVRGRPDDKQTTLT